MLLPYGWGSFYPVIKSVLLALDLLMNVHAASKSWNDSQYITFTDLEVIALLIVSENHARIQVYVFRDFVFLSEVYGCELGKVVFRSCVYLDGL